MLARGRTGCGRGGTGAISSEVISISKARREADRGGIALMCTAILTPSISLTAIVARLGLISAK